MLADYLTTVYVIRGLTGIAIQYYVSGCTEYDGSEYVSTEIWSQDISVAKEFDRVGQAEEAILADIGKCDTRYEIIPVIKQEWN